MCAKEEKVLSLLFIDCWWRRWYFAVDRACVCRTCKHIVSSPRPLLSYVWNLFSFPLLLWLVSRSVSGPLGSAFLCRLPDMYRLRPLMKRRVRTRFEIVNIELNIVTLTSLLWRLALKLESICSGNNSHGSKVIIEETWWFFSPLNLTTFCIYYIYFNKKTLLQFKLCVCTC